MRGWGGEFRTRESARRPEGFGGGGEKDRSSDKKLGRMGKARQRQGLLQHKDRLQERKRKLGKERKEGGTEERLSGCYAAGGARRK